MTDAFPSFGRDRELGRGLVHNPGKSGRSGCGFVPGALGLGDPNTIILVVGWEA